MKAPACPKCGGDLVRVHPVRECHSPSTCTARCLGCEGRFRAGDFFPTDSPA